MAFSSQDAAPQTATYSSTAASSLSASAASTSDFLSTSEQRRELESLEVLLREAGYKDTRVFTPEAERLRQAASRRHRSASAHARPSIVQQAPTPTSGGDSSFDSATSQDAEGESDVSAITDDGRQEAFAADMQQMVHAGDISATSTALSSELAYEQYAVRFVSPPPRHSAGFNHATSNVVVGGGFFGSDFGMLALEDQHESSLSSSCGITGASTESSPSFGNSALTSPNMGMSAHEYGASGAVGLTASSSSGLDWWNSLMGVPVTPAQQIVPLPDADDEGDEDEATTPLPLAHFSRGPAWLPPVEGGYTMAFEAANAHPQPPAMSRKVSDAPSSSSAQSYSSGGSARKRKVLNRLPLDVTPPPPVVEIDTEAETETEGDRSEAFEPGDYEQAGSDDEYAQNSRRSSVIAAPLAQAQEVEASSASPVRRAHLRHAISTPILDIKRPPPVGRPLARLGNVGRFWSYEPPKAAPATATAAAAATKPRQVRKMKSLVLGPSKPASPRLVTRSAAVVCETIGGEDLPPLPTAKEASSTATSRGLGGLRHKLSLQILRSEERLVSRPPTTSAAPTLVPRAQWASRDVPASSSSKGFNADYGSAISDADAAFFGPDFSKSFFYSPATPPKHNAKPKQPKRQESIKSLRAHLLKSSVESRLPAPPPPVPPIPSRYRRTSTTPAAAAAPKTIVNRAIPPPVLAISSPGACEAGLPPRELVLEGEEWESGSPRMQGSNGFLGRREKQKQKGMAILSGRW